MSAGEPAGNGQLPVPPAAAPAAAMEAYFGVRSPLAEAFAEHLGTTAVERGLLGPREVPRLWTRHILNCAAVAPLLPQRADVVDVGSGAGLPGIVLAIAREDVHVTLVEPLLRRVAWLEEVTSDLGLGNVAVLRGRAEELDGGWADVATARAVAPLAKLSAWCLPLVRSGGTMLAIKGRSAAEELVETADRLPAWVRCSGASSRSARTCWRRPPRWWRSVRVTVPSGRLGVGSGLGAAGADRVSRESVGLVRRVTATRSAQGLGLVVFHVNPRGFRRAARANPRAPRPREHDLAWSPIFSSHPTERERADALRVRSRGIQRIAGLLAGLLFPVERGGPPDSSGWSVERFHVEREQDAAACCPPSRDAWDRTASLPALA